MDDPRSGSALTSRSGGQGPDPLIGRVINDRYRVISLLARGGMGRVYRAEQQPLGRQVALKVLHAPQLDDVDPEFHKRFFLEASVAAKLTHPNTVTVFDFGKTDEGIYYLAMELLDGRTLHAALRADGVFPPERAMHITRQLCRSLREAHALGVIHRDLKPANVYLVQHGDERDFVKVLDFGLVKKVEDKGEELTQTGLFMGSPKYMSPEQIRGEPVDVRTDVYSLGVLLYEMLTGKPPFERASSVNILMAHMQDSIPPMKQLNAGVRVPAELEALVRKCMAKDAESRFGSMEEVLTALKRCAGAGPGLSDELPLEGRISTPSERALGFSVGESLPAARFSDPPRVVPSQRPKSFSPEAARRVAPLVFAVVVLALVGAAFWRLEQMQRAEQVGVRASEPVRKAPVAASAPAVTAPVPLGNTAHSQTVLVSLRSIPPGATVVVDDKEYGPTPALVEWSGAEAAPGREVTFRFQRKGYRDLTVTRQIRGDRLDVEAPPMDPIPVRRPTRAPRPSPVPAPMKAPVPAPLKAYKVEPY